MTTTNQAVAVLPDEDAVGKSRAWVVPSGDDVVHVAGAFLGLGTSYQLDHRHSIERFATKTEKCRACRWFEPRIFRENDGLRRYLIHRTGRSIVPGELTLTSHEWVLGAYEVIEVLTTRRRDPRTGDRTPYLTAPAARVLAQAAANDDDINQAYIDRAVA